MPLDEYDHLKTFEGREPNLWFPSGWIPTNEAAPNRLWRFVGLISCLAACGFFIAGVALFLRVVTQELNQVLPWLIP